jgi:hypothetical protein
MAKLDDTFILYACNILAETNSGLSGMKITEYCNSYAIKFNRVIPHGICPFKAPNKRTALRENLNVFDASEQFEIIKDLCDLLPSNNEKVKELRSKLFIRYGTLASEKISQTELIQKTKHWLFDYPTALKQYESALTKFESGIFERNTLDDLRLSFELLVKKLVGNNKSLENQIPEIGCILDKAGTSIELKNMVQKIIDYYTKYQNSHVKHDDLVNSNEIEYVIELTSVIMKFLIKANAF